MDQHLTKWINEELERVRTAASNDELNLVKRECWGFLRGLCLGKTITPAEYDAAMDLCRISTLERMQEFGNGSKAA